MTRDLQAEQAPQRYQQQVQAPPQQQRIAVDVRPRNKPLGDQVITGVVTAGLLILLIVLGGYCGK